MTAEELYQEALVRLARAGTGAGRLEGPDRAATADNPLCGDRVAVELRLREGRVEALAHRVRGCLLCEAAASLLGGAAPGLDAAGLERLRGAVEGLLREGAPPPAGAPEGLAAFAPVQAVPSRHACVLLPFDALRAALAGAGR